jgi:hypothetical protein
VRLKEGSANPCNSSGDLLDGASTAVCVAAGADRVPGANGTITTRTAVPYSASAVARLAAVVVVVVHVGVSFVANRDGVQGERIGQGETKGGVRSSR